MRKLPITVWAVAATLALMSTPQVAVADPVNCGDFLTKDTTLEADLYCPAGFGPTIAAHGVTLDLGGHTLRGELVPDWPHYGVRIVGQSRVTIKNGTIENFTLGVWAQGVRDLRLTHLVFKGPEPDGFSSTAVAVRLSRQVVIENCSFLGPIPTDFGTAAIDLQGVDGVKVHNIDVHGYATGLSFGPGDFATGEGPTNGEITDSSFSGSTQLVKISASTHAHVTGNHVSDCTPLPYGSGTVCDGILVGWRADDPSVGPSGVTVKHNYIHNVPKGLQFYGGVFDSQIIGNHVYNNDWGILLSSGSTGNSIKSNITFGNNFVDLGHDADASPNHWVGNSCETKYGADIPDC